jgi:uncharacterized protein YqeY
MSELIQKLKDRLPITMRDPALAVEKDLIRLVLGEVQLAESREEAKTLVDVDVQRFIQKTIDGNDEIIVALAGKGDERVPRLQAENAILKSWLPSSLSEAEVLTALETIRDSLMGAKSDGQATGMALAHFKKQGQAVQGPVVNAAVKKFRAN